MSLRSSSAVPLLIVLLIIAILTFLPFAAEAQFSGEPLVPCGSPGQPECLACHLVELADNVVDFGIYLGVFIATLLFIYAGFLYVTAAGSSSQIARATSHFKTVFIGFVLALVGWLVVNLIMTTLFVGSSLDLATGLQPWKRIECVEPEYVEPSYIDENFCTPGNPAATPDCIGVAPPPPSSAGPLEHGTPGCPTCEALDGRWTSANPEQVDPRLNERLRTYHDELGADADAWRITDAYNPGGGHSNPCHAGGMCADISLIGGGVESGGLTSAEITKIKAAQDAATASGLFFQYEVTTRDGTAQYLDELQAAGINVKNIGWASGDHASIYYKK